MYVAVLKFLILVWAGSLAFQARSRIYMIGYIAWVYISRWDDRFYLGIYSSSDCLLRPHSPQPQATARFFTLPFQYQILLVL